MDDRVVITLFRHGVTEDNRRGAYIGWTNSRLSDEATFPEVNEDDYDLIWMSDLDRCTETAERLFPSKEKMKNEAFREMHFGEWEGKTYAELEYEDRYRRWISDPLTVSPPGGESFKEFGERVDKAFDSVIDQVKQTPNRSAAIVTHGGVIRYLLSKYAPIERSFWEWHVQHGTGVSLEWKRSEWRRGARCISLREVPITAKPNG
ncbi:histidine phosphatase family protein [Alkalihalobacillus macyae]|uniref:histidine phosphatase family protein n=1 Tax=Guptibacillus hwajinpoensis TaxID=208199 RepID=UPI00273CD937|nr:histidine phosphatase family protein [Alkalihalobacillus macyae]MDP4551640.1 histidine phosphatase family protein [Alkalihalobacillus macyae]